MGIILLEIFFFVYGKQDLISQLHPSIILMLFSFISSLIALQWINNQVRIVINYLTQSNLN